MLKIIGTKNCGKCLVVKKILDEKNISYTYYNIEEIDQENQNKIMNLAKQYKQSNLPLIIRDEKIITLEEI